MSSVKFDRTPYFAAINEQAAFKDADSIKQYVKDHTQFHYGKVNFKTFSQKYEAVGWQKRKILALPQAFWSGVVMAIYHLAAALFLGFPTAFAGNRKYFDSKGFSVVRDLQRSLWLVGHSLQ